MLTYANVRFECCSVWRELEGLSLQPAAARARAYVCIILEGTLVHSGSYVHTGMPHEYGVQIVIRKRVYFNHDFTCTTSPLSNRAGKKSKQKILLSFRQNTAPLVSGYNQATASMAFVMPVYESSDHDMHPDAFH